MKPFNYKKTLVIHFMGCTDVYFIAEHNHLKFHFNNKKCTRIVFEENYYYKNVKEEAERIKSCYGDYKPARNKKKHLTECVEILKYLAKQSVILI